MKIIKSSVELINPPKYKDVLETIAHAGRTCYQSYDNELDNIDKNIGFVTGIVKSGHESVIEHIVVTAGFVVNRAVSHQIVRHRIAAYSQESQRYCNYASNKFNNSVDFIEPVWYTGASDEAKRAFKQACESSEASYFSLIKEHGLKPEQARDVLPNACCTTLIATYNLREWRHILNLRCFGGADPAIKVIMAKALEQLNRLYPCIFNDIMDKYLLEGINVREQEQNNGR